MLAACWLLEPETEAMLTTLTMALLLGQFPTTCATCGGERANEGANGWFPFFSPTGWDRIRNVCSGEILGFGASKCPCPLGMPVPNGDLWAMQMHGYNPNAPVSTPAPPPRRLHRPQPLPRRPRVPRPLRILTRRHSRVAAAARPLAPPAHLQRTRQPAREASQYDP